MCPRHADEKICSLFSLKWVSGSYPEFLGILGQGKLMSKTNYGRKTPERGFPLGREVGTEGT